MRLSQAKSAPSRISQCVINLRSARPAKQKRNEKKEKKSNTKIAFDGPANATTPHCTAPTLISRGLIRTSGSVSGRAISKLAVEKHRWSGWRGPGSGKRIDWRLVVCRFTVGFRLTHETRRRHTLNPQPFDIFRSLFFPLPLNIYLFVIYANGLLACHGSSGIETRWCMIFNVWMCVYCLFFLCGPELGWRCFAKMDDWTVFD